ncbi:MAG: hypothetical protein K8S22_07100 [Betaproteobacteria bacterium]|nr:hypothetical protein [Betaproteobacteria bacterium]
MDSELSATRLELRRIFTASETHTVCAWSLQANFQSDNIGYSCRSRLFEGRSEIAIISLTKYGMVFIMKWNSVPNIGTTIIKPAKPLHAVRKFFFCHPERYP